MTLSDEEISLLLQALDSHEYWQLSDSDTRNNGASTVDDGDDADIDACRALAHRLEAAQLGRETPPAAPRPAREDDEDEDDD